MKTILSLALAAATVVSLAQSRPTSVTVLSKPVMAQAWELPENPDARNVAVREKVYKFANSVSPALTYDLEQFDRYSRPGHGDAIFAGLYNALLTSRDIRWNKAYSDYSPVLRGTLDTPPSMVNSVEDRGLYAIAMRPKNTLDVWEAAKILGEYQNENGRLYAYQAFMAQDSAVQDAVLKFLSAAARDANSPMYPVTLVERVYTWAPIR